jgi:hypothetical protein
LPQQHPAEHQVPRQHHCTRDAGIAPRPCPHLRSVPT